VNGFLLDTNVLSEFSRQQGADQSVRNWLATVDDSRLSVSVLALAELRRGIEALELGKRRLQLTEWFEQELVPFFGSRILPISQNIADRWAVLSVRLDSKGKPQPIFDGLMAVTAIEYDLAMVTRNVKDFINFGVPVINPWQTKP
jgi:toxin FitB